MDVRVHGKNMRVSEEMRLLAEDKVQHVRRIFDDGGPSDVEFTERHNPRLSDDRYRVEITSTVAGHLVRVEASSFEERGALDMAADKYERQLRRLKERLIQRSRKASNKHLNQAPEPSEEESDQGPHIVRTKRFEMRPMTPEEAALQMEMLGHDFFFFLDAESGKHSVGLIEPE